MTFKKYLTQWWQIMGKRGGIRRYPIQQGKIDKYQNTVSKIIEIPIPHVQLVTHT